MQQQIVIIGGDAAGMSAAMQIRRRQPDWQVTVFEMGNFTSYGACGIPYVFTGDVENLEALVVISPEGFRKKGVDVRTRHQALALNAEQQRLTVKNLETGESFEQPYDQLLIATGAQAIVPPWPGLELQGITTVKNLQDAYQLQSLLAAKPRKAVIVGAGYIGLEMAEALQHQGLEVTVLERLPGVMGGIDPELTTRVSAELEKYGVHLHLGVTVTGFEGEAGRVRQVNTDQGSFAADLVLLSLGVKPQVDFLKDSGLRLGVAGAIVTDPQQRTSLPGVFAAGDCATAWHRLLEKPAYIPLALTANRQGRVAGTVMAGGQEQFPGVLGTAVTKVFDLVVARTGLDAQSAAREGLACASVSATAPAKAHYYQGHGEVTVRLFYDPESQRLLGGLLFGDDPSLGKRADILATALSAGMGIVEVSDLDLSYAPPFAPVWDPLLQAANKARFQLMK